MPLRCQVWTTVGNTLFINILINETAGSILVNSRAISLRVLSVTCCPMTCKEADVMPRRTRPPDVFRKAHTVCIASFNSPVDFFSSRVRVSSFLMSYCISALVIIVVTFVFAYL